MDLIAQFIDIVLNLERHLSWVVQNYGAYVYAILFAIIFCETGLVVTPFLPGDSLLFVAGTLAATGHMDVHALFGVLCAASFLGDNTNYWVGRFVGPRVFRSTSSRLLNREHLERTHRFYERHGGKTIVIARFMPIVRTFAPFVAGIGRMNYAQFLGFSAAGSVFWIGFFVYGGYLFGNLPFVKQNLTWFIIGIVLVSVAPGLIAWIRARTSARAAAVQVGDQ
ncbi:MAG: DedA family protein [Betaproteobacteria bacterium]|nr:MAG: DedA family protein [Betaproteobacteria bacterium]